jgi:hypothetical protein
MDIVYLKNGSVIKGEIIEQVPNQSIKIQTSDGNIFVYNFSDIEKITKETIVPQPKIETEATPSGETGELKGGFSIAGGVSFPLGNYGGTSDVSSNSYAETGYAFSVEYDAPLNNLLYGLISLTIASNSIDGGSIMKSMGYSSDYNDVINVGSGVGFAPMVGLGLQSAISPTIAVYLSAQVGMLIGFEPSITVSSNGTQLFNQSATDAAAFSFGSSAGILINKRFIIGLRYLTASPTYTEQSSQLSYDFSSGNIYNQNYNISNERSVSMLLLQVGVIF